MFAAHALELSYRDAELIGDCGDCNRPCEVLFHEQKRASHSRLTNCFRQRGMWLCITAGALTIKQQYLAGLLSHGAAQVLLNQVGGESCGSRATSAGDSRPVRKEQP